MTEVMAPQSLGLSTPTSRQDVVSALLSDYETSFGHEVSSNKELPPPPPTQANSVRKDSLSAIQRMAAKFQLRDEEVPVTPNGSRKDASHQRSRRRIVSRSLSREGKPASLKLVVSNGSTASIPLTPAASVPTQVSSPSGQFEGKDLPPPPPEKSAKRNPMSQAAMGNQQSATAKDLTRNDSLLSQNEDKVSTDIPSNIAPVVTRKAVPMAAVKTVKSLAGLGKASPSLRNNIASATSAPREPIVNSANSGPAPPQKAFVDADLPSISRVKAPASPLHMRGKSSTGFDIFKMASPKAPTVVVNTITPDMTPSPTLKPDMALNDMAISPASPLPPPLDQNRPFSFESNRQAPKAPVSRPSTSTGTSSRPPTKAPSPSQNKTFGPSAASSNQTTTRPSTSPGIRPQQQQQQPPRHQDLPDSPPSSPPFIPLTRQPIPRPASAIPPISSAQLACYTAHRTNIWSNNVFQPTGCQICHDNARDRKWTCVWCQLRICKACSEELRMVPGKNLKTLLESREAVLAAGKGKGGVRSPAVRNPKNSNNSNPGIVVSSADEL